MKKRRKKKRRRRKKKKKKKNKRWRNKTKKKNANACPYIGISKAQENRLSHVSLRGDHIVVRLPSPYRSWNTKIQNHNKRDL
jgi:hypothetical protein